MGEKEYANQRKTSEEKVGGSQRTCRGQETGCSGKDELQIAGP